MRLRVQLHRLSGISLSAWSWEYNDTNETKEMQVSQQTLIHWQTLILSSLLSSIPKLLLKTTQCLPQYLRERHAIWSQKIFRSLTNSQRILDTNTHLLVIILKLTLRSAAGLILFLPCLSNIRTIYWCLLSGLQHRDDLGSEPALPLTSQVAMDTHSGLCFFMDRMDRLDRMPSEPGPTTDELCDSEPVTVPLCISVSSSVNEDNISIYAIGLLLGLRG